MTNPALLQLRIMMRRLGVNRVAARILNRSGYEARLLCALRNSIRDGDCVWDVGANVGWYTVQFAQWVGTRGHVVAYEPDQRNVSRLLEAAQDHTNVAVLPLGLSNAERTSAFRSGTDELRTTGMIIAAAADNSVAETVALARGDWLVERGQALMPNIVKIDVEGHELEVLEGMAELLEQQALRDIFVEIHFAVLEAQARRQTPSAIEELLRSKQFSIEWVDPSHLHANR